MTIDVANPGANKTTLASALQAMITGPVFNVMNYGAAGDGVTNDRTAIQNAIDAASTAGGGVVFFPPGIYLKAGSSSAFQPKSNVVMRGVTGQSTIKLDPTSGTNPLLRNTSTPFSNFHIQDLIFDGGRTNANYALGSVNNDVYYGTNVSMQNVTVQNMLFFGMGFGFSDQVLIENCRFLNINRDGLYCWDTSNLRIANNYFEGINDDAISVHTSSAATPPLRSKVVITGNTFYRCQGIHCLGPKSLLIADNVMNQMMSYGIAVNAATTQGDTAGFGVIIRNNVINDVFLRQEASPLNQEAYYIRLGSLSRNAGGGSAAPGLPNTGTGAIVDLFGTTTGNFWKTDVDGATALNPGAYWWLVDGNILTRTLPAASAVSDWGGASSLQVGSGGQYSGAIPESALQMRGIIMDGSFRHVMISRNQIATGKPCVTFYGQSKGTTTIDQLAYWNVCLDNNLFQDFQDRGLDWQGNSGATKHDIKIRGNVFDGDPRHVHSNRGANGTWAANTYPWAIYMGNCEGKLVVGNDFKNVCNITQDATAGTNTYAANVQRLDPASSAFSTSNKGIGAPMTGSIRMITIIEDCDPTSSTYGTIKNNCVLEGTAQPSTGTYMSGHYVKNSAPSLAAGKVTVGWTRLTTGSGHVANTDWAAAVVPNA